MSICFSHITGITEENRVYGLKTNVRQRPTSIANNERTETLYLVTIACVFSIHTKQSISIIIPLSPKLFIVLLYTVNTPNVLCFKRFTPIICH